MTFKVVTLLIAALAVSITSVVGHGRLCDPPHRGYAWRLGFDTPENYNDNENYCGGFSAQYIENEGKCGVCGDNFSDERPRDNENGGTYGTGTIVKTYKVGSVIEVAVNLTSSHLGDFEFSLCPLEYEDQLETEECFDAYKLPLADGSGYKFTDVYASAVYKIEIVLPKDLTCEHCVFRWHYRTGNSWGECGDGEGALGCGNQEVFRTCSDISIVSNSQRRLTTPLHYS